MTIKSAGFAVFTNEAIFGIGLTEHEAFLDASEYLGPAWLTEDDPTIRVAAASQALLDEVKNRGGAIAWRKVDHVLCTIPESECQP